MSTCKHLLPCNKNTVAANCHLDWIYWPSPSTALNQQRMIALVNSWQAQPHRMVSSTPRRTCRIVPLWCPQWPSEVMQWRNHREHWVLITFRQKSSILKIIVFDCSTKRSKNTLRSLALLIKHPDAAGPLTIWGGDSRCHWCHSIHLEATETLQQLNPWPIRHCWALSDKRNRVAKSRAKMAVLEGFNRC